MDERAVLSMLVLAGTVVMSSCFLMAKPDIVFNVSVIETVQKPTFCSSHFLSVALGDGLVQHNFRNFDFNSKKLQNLATALSPLNLRFGGTRSNFLTFDENATYVKTRDLLNVDEIEDGYDDDDVLLNESKRASATEKWHDFTMNGDQWEGFTSFAAKVGWNITFMFNLLKSHDSGHQVWDPTNAKQLLDFSAKKGIKIAAFQLGNEPNSNGHKFGFKVIPSNLVKTLQTLRTTLKQYPEYRQSAIYGPEATSLGRHPGAKTFFDGFFAAGGCRAVNEASWHHYYIDGRTATVEQMMDPGVLDTLKADFEVANKVMSSHCDIELPLRLTETSSCFGGGAPGLSDRYVAGFMWLDKLGLSSQAGVSVVHRQTFFSGAYALLTFHGLVPTPDYFLSVLYKRLILGPVLRAMFEPSTQLLRMYAHCVRQDFYKYPAGAVVMYYMNLDKSDVTLRLTKYKDEELDLFLLTPGDDGLTSKFVKLNGKKLEMQGTELPSLDPQVHKGDIKVASQSFGFIVIPNAQVKACL